MSNKKKSQIKENTFDMGIAGGGTLNTVASWDTFSSPDVTQNINKFTNPNNDKALGPNSNTAKDMPASGSQFDAEVDRIYARNSTPSPDEVISGLNYELNRMIKKNKTRAKEIVLNNLLQDPHYYGKLKMLNINDKEMMDTNQLPPTDPEDKMTETIKILDAMMESRMKKTETPKSYLDAINDTREKKNKKYKG